MKPIKANAVEKQFRPPFSRPILDLREHNLVHAAPMENGHPFLYLQFDAASGSLLPRAPKG